MEISLNGNTLEVDHGCSLQNFLEVQEMDQRQGIAVALNNSVIPRNDWPSHQLNTGDSILIITATQGG